MTHREDRLDRLEALLDRVAVRLDRIAERREALAQTVEMRPARHRETDPGQQATAELVGNLASALRGTNGQIASLTTTAAKQDEQIGALLHIAEIHERRIGALEAGDKRT